MGATTTGLKMEFAADRLGPRLKRLRMHEPPRNAVTSRLRFASVVSPQSVVQVLTRACVPPTSFFTLQNVHVKHESGREDSNFRPLGPEPSALTRLSYAPGNRGLQATFGRLSTCRPVRLMRQPLQCPRIADPDLMPVGTIPACRLTNPPTMPVCSTAFMHRHQASRCSARAASATNNTSAPSGCARARNSASSAILPTSSSIARSSTYTPVHNAAASSSSSMGSARNTVRNE